MFGWAECGEESEYGERFDVGKAVDRNTKSAGAEVAGEKQFQDIAEKRDLTKVQKDKNGVEYAGADVRDEYRAKNQEVESLGYCGRGRRLEMECR